MRTNTGLYSLINGSKPILFIMAKSFGVTKNFLDYDCDINVINEQFKDIRYAHKEFQFRGLKSHEAFVVQLPRYEEHAESVKMNSEALVRGFPIISAAKFLELLKPN